MITSCVEGHSQYMDCRKLIIGRKTDLKYPWWVFIRIKFAQNTADFMSRENPTLQTWSLLGTCQVWESGYKINQCGFHLHMDVHAQVQFGNSSGLSQSSHLLAIYGAELHGGVRRVFESKAMILTWNQLIKHILYVRRDQKSWM